MGNVMCMIPNSLDGRCMENVFCKESKTDFFECIGYISIQLYIGIAYGLIGINTRLVPEIVTYTQIFQKSIFRAVGQNKIFCRFIQIGYRFLKMGVAGITSAKRQVTG